MLTYKAMYKFLERGVHAEVLDFPGTITSGETLQEARRLLASALVDMAETALLRGEPLPQPDPSCTDPEADVEEPTHLLLTAASHISVVPRRPPQYKREDLLKRVSKRNIHSECKTGRPIGREAL